MTSSTSSFSSFARAWLLPWLAFTAAFGLALDRLTVSVVLPHMPGGAVKIDRLLYTDDADETPIFGSSRAEDMVLPSEIAEHAYNYGLSGTEFEVTSTLLEVELAKPRRTSLLVNIDPDFFTGGSLGDVAVFVPYADEPHIWALLTRFGRDHGSYRVPGARFYGLYETYGKLLINSINAPTHLFDRGATAEKNRLPAAQFAGLVEARRGSRSEFSIPPDKDRRFQELLDRRPDRRVVIVFAPFHPSFYEGFTGLEALLRYFDLLERAHPNVVTLYFDGRTYGDELFYDTSHLNVDGARRYSRELRARLMARGVPL